MDLLGCSSGSKGFLLLDDDVLGTLFGVVVERGSVSELEEVRSIISILALIFVDLFFVNNDIFKFFNFGSLTATRFFSEIFVYAENDLSRYTNMSL